MKTIITVLTVLFSVNALAFTMPNLQFPEKSEWAKGKVKRACGVQVASTDYGVTTKAQSASGKMAYVYTVYTEQGEMVAQAAAYSDTVWTKATCQ